MVGKLGVLAAQPEGFGRASHRCSFSSFFPPVGHADSVFPQTPLPELARRLPYKLEDVKNAPREDPALVLLFAQLRSWSLQTVKGAIAVAGKTEFNVRFVLFSRSANADHPRPSSLSTSRESSAEWVRLLRFRSSLFPLIPCLQAVTFSLSTFSETGASYLPPHLLHPPPQPLSSDQTRSPTVVTPSSSPPPSSTSPFPPPSSPAVSPLLSRRWRATSRRRSENGRGSSIERLSRRSRSKRRLRRSSRSTPLGSRRTCKVVWPSFELSARVFEKRKGNRMNKARPQQFRTQ